MLGVATEIVGRKEDNRVAGQGGGGYTAAQIRSMIERLRRLAVSV